jgi:menaquinol-cytochrome c reductase iron-sulfur subunit
MVNTSENAPHPKRRSFFKAATAFLSGLIGVVMGIPLIGSAVSPAFKQAPKKWVDMGIVERLKGSNYKQVNYTFQSKDGWVQINKKRSVYVTDEGEGNFVVFSRACTHLNCLVRWNGSKSQFFCPCHGGVFDKDGKVIAGPPPRPLEKLPVKVENGLLYVKEGNG